MTTFAAACKRRIDLPPGAARRATTRSANEGLDLCRLSIRAPWRGGTLRASLCGGPTNIDFIPSRKRDQALFPPTKYYCEILARNPKFLARHNKICVSTQRYIRRRVKFASPGPHDTRRSTVLAFDGLAVWSIRRCGVGCYLALTTGIAVPGCCRTFFGVVPVHRLNAWVKELTS